MFKVRFHLGRGENYMRWQVKDQNGVVSYYDPESVKLSLEQCTLKNNKKLAREIHEGANKTVCAWILCEKVFFESDDAEGKEIMYNPRKSPYWTDGISDLDNKKFKKIYSQSRRLFVTE